MQNDFTKAPTMNPLLLEKIFLVLTGLWVPAELVAQVKESLWADKGSMPETGELPVELSDFKKASEKSDEAMKKFDKEEEWEEASPIITSKKEWEEEEEPEEDAVNVKKQWLLHLLNGSSKPEEGDEEKDPKKILSKMKWIKFISVG